MRGLNTQLRESFFNPLTLLLPMLAFLILNPFFGKFYAFAGASITTAAVVVYAYFRYNNLFKWALFHVLIFLVICLLIVIASHFIQSEIISPVIDEIVIFFSFIVLYFFRKPLIKLSDKLVSPLIPMGNNITELNKTLKVISILVSGHVILYLTFHLVNNTNTTKYLSLLNTLYIAIAVFLAGFVFIKTKIIHSQLANEPWLPIITPDGKVIGSIQRVSSLSDRRRYLHPVVKGILVNDGRILMQKPQDEDLFYKPVWDNLISSHVNLGEKAEDCLKRTAYKNFAIENLKSFYLTKYIQETPYERQYVLVFIICNYSGEITPNAKKIESTKWWTLPQIENSLNAGIFDEKFIHEFDLLKRSGLLESEEYDCKCELEETGMLEESGFTHKKAEPFPAEP